MEGRMTLQQAIDHTWEVYQKHMLASAWATLENKESCSQCADAEEAANTADYLNMKGIEWDFVYQKDGQKGIWIEILKGESNE